MKTRRGENEISFDVTDFLAQNWCGHIASAPFTGHFSLRDTLACSVASIGDVMPHPRQSQLCQGGKLPLEPLFQKGGRYALRERKNVIQIRVTETEKKRIERNAKRCRMSVSEYLRSLANGHSPAEYPSDLHSLCFDIELLMEEYYGRHDEKFTAYLKAFLDDVRTVLFGNGGDTPDGSY